MPVTHLTPVFSVDNAAIYPMTADTGANPTYGTKIDVPGIRTVSFEPDVLAKELFGDNAIIARSAKARQVNSTVEMAKTSLDILVQLLGGAVVDTGTTPNMIATYTLKGSDAAKYFKLQYRVLGVEVPGPSGGGDLHVVLYKCKITSLSVPANMEDYGIFSCGVSAVATSSTSNKIADIIVDETAVALPA